MKSFNVEELDERQIYKLMSGSIIPRPIAWVTTQNRSGLVNVAPFSFFNVVSSQPPLVSIAFTAKKDTFNNIMATKEAVIHLISSQNVKEMNLTASKLNSNESEADKYDLELIPSQRVTVPSLKNSLVRFETVLYKHIPLENDAQFVILKLKNFIFDEEVLEESSLHILAEKLDPVARLAGNNFATLGEQWTLIRPE
ncbi:flavin reductase family protein [Lactococcus fujiensis]|nr:flavin reductase family protein [Lactococcus fujiensis]